MFNSYVRPLIPKKIGGDAYDKKRKLFLCHNYPPIYFSIFNTI